MAAQACDPSTQEAEAGGSPRVRGQPGLQSETPSQQRKEKKKSPSTSGPQQASPVLAAVLLSAVVSIGCLGPACQPWQSSVMEHGNRAAGGRKTKGGSESMAGVSAPRLRGGWPGDSRGGPLLSPGLIRTSPLHSLSHRAAPSRLCNQCRSDPLGVSSCSTVSSSRAPERPF